VSDFIRPGIRRLLHVVTRRSARRDADDELQLHLSLRTNQLIAEGMSPDAARAEAERRFGAIDVERGNFLDAALRRERRLRWRDHLDGLRADVLYAARTLRREAGFTTFALVIVALGVGASATVFSLVNGVLLRPLPFRDSSRLVWIANISDNGVDEWRFQVGHFVDTGNRSQSLAGLTGFYTYYSNGNAILTRNGESERLTRVPVTCNFFPFLGVKPQLGRSFNAEECRAESGLTAVLTDRTWRERFASDPSVVGRTVTINDRPVMVVGVLPASFDFPSVFTPGAPADLFAPFPLSELNDRRGNTLAVIGRLRPGVSVARANTELVALGKQLTAEFPRRNTLRPHVVSLDEHVNGHVRAALVVLAAAVAAVMLIVALNLASLQFARMSARGRELAVRLALGASRARLIRQALVESLVLTGAAAIAGIGVAGVATRYVSRLHAFEIPLLSRVGVDIAVLLAATIVAVATGVIVGVLPPNQMTSDPNDALKDGQRGATHGKGYGHVRSALVVAEIAAAFVLLIASGLLLRSFIRVLDADLGFRPDGIVTVRVDRAGGFKDLATATAYYDEISRRVRAVPGVTSAALADLLPFNGDRSWGIAGEGQVYARGQYPEGFVRVIGNDYFRTMGVSIRSGRDFSDGDTPDAPPVVIINESLAHTLWPTQNAVGQRMGQGGSICSAAGCRFATVIAVVANVRHVTLEGAYTGEIYFPMRQYFDFSRVNLVVRTSLPMSQLIAAARRALEPIAPEAAKQTWVPVQDLIDKVSSPRRFVVLVLGGFAAFALLLAALGIYALISYGVSQRQQEIGIRLALGASGGDVRRAILRSTLVLAASGAVIGVVGAVLLVPALGGMLFGVTWRDPASFGWALALLLFIATCAGLVPAHRASRVDPSVALRG
jgi:predicted permease